MADADEDAIHLPSSHDSAQIETDLSDETQDFRFLSFLSDNSQTSLPRRGEKDFEPNPTLYQADILAASRQAMHNALAYPRLHNPRNKVIAIYAPAGPAPPLSASAPRTMETVVENEEEHAAPQKTNDDTQAEPKKPAVTEKGMGVSADACVYVRNPKGAFFRTMGQADRWNRVWLLPEEALYLLERGSLEIWWPLSSTGCARDDGEDEEMGVPMSLQAAYACFIGRGGLTLERFSVYTGLKRLGYTLIRAPSWDESTDGAAQQTSSEIAERTTRTQKPQNLGLTGVFARLFNWIYPADPTASTVAGPVVGLGIHRSYMDIYRKLAMIPWYEPAAVECPTRQTTPPFRTAFYVFKPSTPFRKSAPPEPDFRIAVVNARTQSTIPTIAQLGALLESTPLDPPRGEKMERMLYMRLRHGYRNVILAVVDQGVVSYLRIADAAFGKEKLYEIKVAPQGNKRGGFSRQKSTGR